MPDPFHQKQFELNESLIAKFAGLEPLPPLETEKELPEGKCEVCGELVPVVELERNANACDRCASGKGVE
jgi:hypothetical protein